MLKSAKQKCFYIQKKHRMYGFIPRIFDDVTKSQKWCHELTVTHNLVMRPY